MHAIAKFLTRNKGFITFMLCMIMFRSAIADWNVVPTRFDATDHQDRRPHPLVDARRVLRHPPASLTHISLLHLADPRRGATSWVLGFARRQ